MPFNPLYALTGVPQPGATQREIEEVKNRVLDLYLNGENATTSTSAEKAGTASKMTMRNGILVKKEDLPVEATPKLKVVLGGTQQDQEEYEEEEGNYDDEERPRDVPNINEDEDGIYSDDERFAGKSKDEVEALMSEESRRPLAQPPSSQSIHQSQSQTRSQGQSSYSLGFSGIDVPAHKPRFTRSEAQLSIGTLPLDDHPGGVSVPAPINMFLKEYQRQGVKFLYEKYKSGKGGILGDDMGLGKTVQVIAFVSENLLGV